MNNSDDISYDTIAALAENASKEDVILVLTSTIATLQKYSMVPKEQVLKNLVICFEKYSGWSERE